MSNNGRCSDFPSEYRLVPDLEGSKAALLTAFIQKRCNALKDLLKLRSSLSQRPSCVIHAFKGSHDTLSIISTFPRESP
jgi:hypothetical protein